MSRIPIIHAKNISLIRVVLQAVSVRCIGPDRYIGPDASPRKGEYVFCSLYSLIGKKTSRDAL